MSSYADENIENIIITLEYESQSRQCLDSNREHTIGWF